MLASALVACILGLRHGNKFKDLKFIVFYPTASLIQGAVAYYAWIFHWDLQDFQADYISESVFVLIETSIIYIFFKKTIVIVPLKLFVHVIFLSFMIYLILMWIFTDAFYYEPNKVYLFQTFCTLTFPIVT